MNPLDAVLWLLAIGLALAAAWWTLPRPVALDWERLFKLTLITLIRGEVERAGGDAEAWLTAGRARVWYHPGGRGLVAKLLNPQAVQPPVPARPGELGLLEALRAAPDPHARLALITQGGGDEPLYEDPASLGPGWDLAAMLGQGASWEAVAAWGPAVGAALARRNDRVCWVQIGGGLELVAALRAAGVRAEGCADPDAAELTKSLHEWTPEPADRLVLLLVDRGASAGVEALLADPSLRDRVRAVVAVGADLGGATGALLAERFTHEALDTELARRVPYLHLAFADPGVDPLGEPGLPLAHTAWPTPPPSRVGRESVEVLDLGLLPGPRAALGAERLARALLIVVSARLALE